MPDIKVSAIASYGEILDALGIEHIDGLSHDYERTFKIDEVSVDSSEVIDELDDRDLLPEPDSAGFNIADIRDAFQALRKGDLLVARVLFDRIFDEDDAAKLAVEAELRNWSTQPAPAALAKAA
jgi:hypothetical protein